MWRPQDGRIVHVSGGGKGMRREDFEAPPPPCCPPTLLTYTPSTSRYSTQSTVSSHLSSLLLLLPALSACDTRLSSLLVATHSINAHTTGCCPGQAKVGKYGFDLADKDGSEIISKREWCLSQSSSPLTSMMSCSPPSPLARHPPILHQHHHPSALSPALSDTEAVRMFAAVSASTSIWEHCVWCMRM